MHLTGEDTYLELLFVSIEITLAVDTLSQYSNSAAKFWGFFSSEPLFVLYWSQRNNIQLNTNAKL